MAKYPVVVYGASGYTGMLIMDWLVDQKIPFTAVARNAARAKQMMDQRVVGLESATYEIVECAHEVESLVKVFSGSKVVCNTVGPFVHFGLETVEACLKAGCHYLDSAGEQEHILALRDTFSEQFRQAGLLLSPSLAYMYTYAEIAAELALETHGVDALETSTLTRGPRGGAPGVSVGSAATIFEGIRHPGAYLYEKELLDYAPNASFNVVCPSLMESVFCLPWGGTSLPVFFQNDSRVRSCASCVGFYDNSVMKVVHGLAEKWEAEYKHLPKEQQDAVISSLVQSTTPNMPPRERSTLQRTTDFAIGRGQLAAVRATVHGVTPYIATGALHAAAVVKLLDNDVAKVGFASSSKAFGHRYMLGFLEQRGLARATITQL
ncbi:saccharopine dehydrogenase family protein [Pseudomonas sp.]|uniref:saccharopine dehydrogenase family protein n=1 Tax=Pseudomonas sp. TaxID=306 RepID=UPI003D6E7D16